MSLQKKNTVFFMVDFINMK